jgi:hypothetical protein
VLAALEAVSTDSLAIFGKNHLSTPILSIKVAFQVDPDTGESIPVGSSLKYTNGSHPNTFPSKSLIYVATIYNMLNVATGAVNLDLLNNRTPNIFTNITHLKTWIAPNLPPRDINSDDWAEGISSFSYGNLTTGYRTWAEMLLDGKPVRLGNPTSLPQESSIVTNYLCHVYQIKPVGTLIVSVFTGSATMLLLVWSAWKVLTAFIAKRMIQPRELECAWGWLQI